MARLRAAESIGRPLGDDRFLSPHRATDRAIPQAGWVTVTPISRPVVKMPSKCFWQRKLPTSFIGRFQLPCSNRARFFG
jgi:hypothetical protein